MNVTKYLFIPKLHIGFEHVNLFGQDIHRVIHYWLRLTIGYKTPTMVMQGPHTEELKLIVEFVGCEACLKNDLTWF